MHPTREQVTAAGYRPVCPHDWSVLIPDGECAVCGWWLGSDDAVPVTLATAERARKARLAKNRKVAAGRAFALLRDADVLDVA